MISQIIRILLALFVFLGVDLGNASINEEKLRSSVEFIVKKASFADVYHIDLKIIKPDNIKLYSNQEKQNGVGFNIFLDKDKSSNVKKIDILWPVAHQHIEKIFDEDFTMSLFNSNDIIRIVAYPEDKKKPLELWLKMQYGICGESCIVIDKSLGIPLHDIWSKKIESKTNNSQIQVNSSQIPLEKPSQQKFLQSSAQESDEAPDHSSQIENIISILFMALFGGFILNFMPCVLPMLSIKLFQIAKNASDSNKVSRIYNSLCTAIGMIIPFAILGLLAAYAKNLGVAIGWGLHFHEPLFVMFLITLISIFLVITLNGGTLTLPRFITQISGIEIRSQYLDSVFTGIVSAVLSTSCSAPFLGTAIAFAITQPPLVIAIIYIFVGIGMATPYILIAIYPRLANNLPRSPRWAMIIKNIMIVSLGAIIAWLIFILSKQLTFFEYNIFVIILMMILFCLRVSKVLKGCIALIGFNILLLQLFLINNAFSGLFDTGVRMQIFDKSNNKNKTHSLLSYRNNQIHQEKSHSKLHSRWVEFKDMEAINKYVKENKNRVVLVNITADWCLTCKINEKMILDPMIHDKRYDDVIFVKGDYTERSDIIRNYLKNHHRYGIPFTAVYGANAPTGILLSEILTASDIEDAIAAALSRDK